MVIRFSVPTFTLLLLMLLSTLSSCGGGGGGGGGGGSDSTPEEQQEDPTEDGVVTFRELRQNIIAPKCLRCHAPFSEEAGVRARVVPGDAEASLLFQMVASGEMPREGDRLSTQELEVVRTYIEGLAITAEELAERE